MQLDRPELQHMHLNGILWKKNDQVQGKMFPHYQFGQYVMSRERVVNKIKEELALLSTEKETQSVYLSGCRGSGKANLLRLLADSFYQEGYTVFFAQCPREIRNETINELKTFLEDTIPT